MHWENDNIGVEMAGEAGKGDKNNRIKNWEKYRDEIDRIFGHGRGYPVIDVKIETVDAIPKICKLGET